MLENTIKEAQVRECRRSTTSTTTNIGILSTTLSFHLIALQLTRVLKDAIPVNQRRPVGTEEDLKQGQSPYLGTLR